MCSLFRNKFRNESFRLNSHDYSSDGTYFITICTHMGLSYFGNISNGKMILSEKGRIAYKIWYEIPKHFSFVSLDEFVVMPNHVHGIIIIQSPTVVGTLHATSLQSVTYQQSVTSQQSATPVGTLHATSLQSATLQQQQPTPTVGTLHTTPLQSVTSQQPATAVRTLHATSLQSETSQHQTKNEFMSTISPKPGSLATVIRSYKSAVSKNIHLSDHDFSWLPRYYDHIIRSDRELNRTRDYIINNPVKWDFH